MLFEWTRDILLTIPIQLPMLANKAKKNGPKSIQKLWIQIYSAKIRFFTQKSCDRLWSTMLWWKPQGILSPAATPHLPSHWRPGRGRQYQGFVMQWIPTAKKQPVTCSDNDKTDQTVFWDDWIFGPIWEPPPQRSPFQAPQPIVIPVLHIQNYSVGRQWHEAGGQH